MFCPPGQDRDWERRDKVRRRGPSTGRRFTDAGDIMTLSYRGFSSSVEYELRLNDAVRLPGALVLHLSRPDGGGAIGRDDLRVDVRLEGTRQAVGDVAPGEQDGPIPCQVLDVSSGGLRIASELGFERDREVVLRVALPDEQGQDDTEPISLTALICWNRADDSGRRTQGLQFTGLPRAVAERYRRYLSHLLPDATAPEAEPDPESAPPLAARRELEAASEASLLQAREVEALRTQHGEDSVEIERLAQRIAELQDQLETSMSRAAARERLIEQMLAAVPAFKRILDEIEDNL